ncbi:DUF4306 domain-containing protein [Bacillus salacetis]|nr:DUF4306 domain-containing protein [Bacillus salacetis]
MKYKRFVISLLILFLSATALFSWYEGSGLLEDEDQWKYTAVFSKVMDDDEVLEKSEIVHADFFLYAVKFHPIFPSAMTVFLLLILFFMGFPFTNKSLTWASMILFIIIFLLSFLVKPAEEGTAIFLNSVKFSSCGLIVCTAILRLKIQKIPINEEVMTNE